MNEKKAKAIIANAERIREKNSKIEQSYPLDDRRDYSYTSVAAAECFLSHQTTSQAPQHVYTNQRQERQICKRGVMPLIYFDIR